MNTERIRESIKFNTWGMFTRKGSLRLTKLAEDVIKSIEEGKDVSKALDTFVYKWERMSDYNSYSEAADTAVRECVWEFFQMVCNSDEAWEKARERAWKRRRRLRFV